MLIVIVLLKIKYIAIVKNLINNKKFEILQIKIFL